MIKFNKEMKIFCSFLLAFFLASHISALPSDFSEYKSYNLQYDGSGDEDTEIYPIIATTTSTFSTTTFAPKTTIASESTTINSEPETTYVSIHQVNDEAEDNTENVSTRFDKLTVAFLKNQQDVYDKVKKDVKNYQILRDASINIFKEAYDQGIAESDGRLKIIEMKKSEIEKSIGIIHENSWNKDENAKNLDDLKERKKLFADMKSQNCENCNGFFNDDQKDAVLQQTDNQIAELEAKIQNQETVTLTDEETRQLKMKYVELIQVYRDEVEEYKRKGKLEVMNNFVNENWKNYAEKIENLHSKVEIKMEKLTTNSLKISKLTSNESMYSFVDDLEDEFSINHGLYKWIPFDTSKNIPSDAVLGGVDADGSQLYVIRLNNNDSYFYGKYAVSYGRRQAYVTRDVKEVSIINFKLLTSKNYTWCDTKTYQVRDTTPSVCKTTHYYKVYRKYKNYKVVIPGTLLKNGECTVGFGSNAYTYTENVSVLGFGSCNSTTTTRSSPFWF